MEAFGIELVQRLSSSSIAVEKVVTAEQRRELAELRRKVDLSLNVLKELCGCAERIFADVNVSPTTRKKSKASTKHMKLDPYPFDCMEIAVPTTEHEFRAAFGDILLRLQSILGVRVSCLSVLP